eukprot:2399667-Prymnesium_polylepis.1
MKLIVPPGECASGPLPKKGCSLSFSGGGPPERGPLAKKTSFVGFCLPPLRATYRRTTLLANEHPGRGTEHAQAAQLHAGRVLSRQTTALQIRAFLSRPFQQSRECGARAQQGSLRTAPRQRELQAQ